MSENLDQSNDPIPVTDNFEDEQPVEDVPMDDELESQPAAGHGQPEVLPQQEPEPEIYQPQEQVLEDQENLVPTHIEIVEPEPDTEENQSAVDIEQEANTTILQVPSSATRFATPSKSLPALKDIETIVTPKSFNVAKDSNDVTVSSSPILTRGLDAIGSNFETSLVSNDSIKLVAGFLSVAEDTVRQIHSEKVFDALLKKSAEFNDLESQNSFLQLKREQITQNSKKLIEELRSKLNKAEELVSNLGAQNEEYTSEKSHFGHRVHELEEANRILTDNVTKLLESEKKLSEELKSSQEGIDQRVLKYNESLNQLTSSNIEQSQKINELTKELNEARNDKFTIKLELTKTTNEVSYLKNQKIWYEDELKSVQARFTDLIKKHESEYLLTSNKLTNLTSKNESLEKLNKSAQSTIHNLRENLDKEIINFSKVNSEFKTEKSKLLEELQNQTKLLELTKVQSEQRVSRVTQLESYVEELKEKLTSTIDELETACSVKTERIIELEEKLRRTEEVLDQELQKESELPRLTDSSSFIASQGISLSALYSEFNHLKKQLVLERSQKEKLSYQLESFVNELESKKPALSNYRDQVKFYENALQDMIGKVETIRQEKIGVERDGNRLRTRIIENENELVSMKKLLKDLGKQLCYYLIHSKIRDSNQDPLTASEKKAIENILERSGNFDDSKQSDSDLLILERLVEFNSIIELRQQNENLLTAVRQLSKKLESNEDENNNFHSAAIEEAKDAIMTLEGELDSLTIKYEAVSKERDILKSFSTNGDQTPGYADARYLSESNKDLQNKLVESDKILKELQKQSATVAHDLNEKLREVTNSRNELSLQLSSIKHTADLAETRFKNAQATIESVREEMSQIRSDLNFWKEQASKQESLLIKKSSELRDAEAVVSKNHFAISNLEKEKQFKDYVQNSLKEELEQLKSDKSNLNEFVINLQSLLKEREESSKDLTDRLNKSVENYQSLQNKLSEKDERIAILTNQAELAWKSQNTKLEQVGEISHHLLETKSKLSEKQTLVESLSAKILELSHTLARRPTIQVDSTTGAASDGDNEKQSLRIELNQLKEDLAISESEINELTNLAKTSEDALIKATNSYEEYRLDTDNKFGSLLREKQSLNDEIQRLKTLLDDLRKETEETTRIKQDEVNELKTQLDNFSSKAAAYDNLAVDYESKLAAISKDLEIQVSIATDNQSKYHEELQKNNDLSKALVLSKEQVETLKTDVLSLTTRLETTQTLLEDKDNSLSFEKLSIQEELESSKTKLAELQEQNKIILTQLELSKDSIGAESEENEGIKDVVGYLRREKEAAEAKISISVEETRRLTLKLTQVTNELSLTKSELAEARSTYVNLNSASEEHSKLSDQLEQLSILRESNRTLRKESEDRLQLVNDLQVQIQQSQVQVEDLKTKISQLGADVDVGSQRVKLVEEENERLKAKANAAIASASPAPAATTVASSPTGDSEEVIQNMKEKYNDLRNKANTRIQSQNEKIKELQDTVSSLNEQIAHITAKNEDGFEPTTDIQEYSQKIAELTQEKASLLSEIEQLKTASGDITNEQQIEQLKKEFETEKAELDEKLKLQYQQQVEDALKKVDPENANQIRAEVKQELEQAYNVKKQELEAALEARKAELEQEYQQKLAEAASTSGNVGVDELNKKHAAEIEKLNSGFATKLEEEKARTKLQVEKLFEVKIKMLNKKVERLEKVNKKNTTPGETINGAQAVGPSGFGGGQENKIALPAIPQVANQNKPLGYPFTESTLTVHRPAVERAEAVANKKPAAAQQHPNQRSGSGPNDKKRSLHNNAQQHSNKKPKE